MTEQTCIIVGAGHAAAQLAASLRQEKWDGRILIIGDETTPPYQRPPLSKGFLAGDIDAEKLLIRPRQLYEKNGIELQLGCRITSLDTATKNVSLDSGETLAFDKLALCTGSRARRVELPGAELDCVFYLRTLADIDNIRRFVRPSGHAVIVGGGYIGLETAAMLRKLGMRVTLLEIAERILQRVTAPEISAFYTRVHTEEGVEIRTGTRVSGFAGRDRVRHVVCADGSRLEADLVVIGAGILPNVELAQAAGLAVDNGILVDEFAVTSHPDIVAAGDCTNHPNARYGTRMRLESVPHASEQAKSAAASLCGKQKAYRALPWFWTDQYDLKMQIAGISQGYDQIAIRGDRDSGRSFAAFYFREGQLLAADCVNRPQEFMISRRLIAQARSLNPEILINEAIAPQAWLDF